MIPQLNLIYAKEWIYKNWSYVALAIALFFLFKSCSGSSELSEDFAKAKAESTIYKNSALVHEKKAIAFRETAEKQREFIKVLRSELEDTKTDLAMAKKETSRKVDKVKTMDLIGIKKYYKDRYNYTNIPIQSKGLVLSDTLNRFIIKDLIKGDGATASLKIAETALYQSEVIIDSLDSVNLTLIKSNDSFMLSVSDLKKANEKADEATKIVEKSLRKEKNKKTFWQVIGTIGIATSAVLFIVK